MSLLQLIEQLLGPGRANCLFSKHAARLGAPPSTVAGGRPAGHEKPPRTRFLLVGVECAIISCTF